MAVRGARLVLDGRNFRPFGFNYTGQGSLGTTAYFQNPTADGLERVRDDFAEAKRLGANTLRIYLELFDFVDRDSRGRTVVRPDRIQAYRSVIAEAEAVGLKLDVTGNLAWKPDSTPAWYDELGHRARWQVQAEFWRAIAGAAADSPAVLCYEIGSEPFVSPNRDDDWYGETFGGLHFTQAIARGVPADRAAETVRAWVRTLSSAIRERDGNHLVGVGVLPFEHGPTSPDAIGDDVDLLIYHDYPAGRDGDPNAIAPYVDRARSFAAHGKPVLLGETSALNADVATQEAYLRAIRPYIAGTLSFYDGRDPDDMAVETIPDAMYQQNLRSYVAMRSEL